LISPHHPNHAITKSLNGERRTAAAGRRRVRILDRESAAGHRVDEVDFGALQVADADRIDEQLDAVRLEYLIPGALTVFLDHQAVLEARAAAALDKYTQAAASLVFLDKQLADFGCRRFRYVDHFLLVKSPSL